MLHLRRITTQKRFIPQIDGLRFVAIASVVFFHIYSALERGAIPPPFTFDDDLSKRGVELFFAISGFILGVPFASHHLLHAPNVKLKAYFLRRLTRLEPPYFLSFPVWMLMQWVVFRRPLRDMAPHLLANSVYMHNLVFGAFPGAVNSVAWSLEVEVQFYVLVPLLSLIFVIAAPRLRRAVILATMAVVAVISLPLYRTLHFHYSIAYYLPFFLAGFLVCDLYLTRKGADGSDNWTPSYLWDAAALCLWPLIWFPGKYLDHLLLPFVIVVLYLAAFRGRICSFILRQPFLTNIGGMCYSIYLFHFPVIYAVKHQTAYWHIGNNFWAFFALQCCFILPAVLFFCGAFFVLIERPCMDRDWPKKLWAHLHPAPLAANPNNASS
ncbi:MAG TPA: acyltransferase [Candidatus Sulfotelmatobacter sp.]|nr:acyltransferase [Candidatus Sulfotelmatobacter sp.]